MAVEDFVKLSVSATLEFSMAGVSDKAELAFYRGLQYCGLNNSHGIIPTSQLSPLGPRRVAEELVAAGFWECVPAGWRYRSWDKWQAELEQLHAKRAKDADRKRIERRKQRDKDLGLGEDDHDEN